MLTLIPWPYKLLTIIALCGAIGTTGYIKGKAHIQKEWNAETQRIEAQAAIERAVNAEKAVAVVSDYAIKTIVIHDRAKTIYKEVKVYVPKEADDNCTVNNGAVWMLDDAANCSAVPRTPGGAYAGPSPIRLSGIAYTGASNYEKYYLVAAQVVGLQNFIKKMRKEK